MLKEKFRTERKKCIVNKLDMSANPPFTVIIMNYEHLVTFRPPTLDPHDGTKDFVNQVQSFKSHVIFLGDLEEMMV